MDICRLFIFASEAVGFTSSVCRVGINHWRRRVQYPLLNTWDIQVRHRTHPQSLSKFFVKEFDPTPYNCTCLSPSSFRGRPPPLAAKEAQRLHAYSGGRVNEAYTIIYGTLRCPGSTQPVGHKRNLRTIESNSVAIHSRSAVLSG